MQNAMQMREKCITEAVQIGQLYNGKERVMAELAREIIQFLKVSGKNNGDIATYEKQSLRRNLPWTLRLSIPDFPREQEDALLYDRWRKSAVS